jgi:hypothetical protein
MKKFIIPVILICAFVIDANAAVKVKNSTAERYAEKIESETGEEFIDEDAAVATLENDIAILDEEIAKCKKQKKGWLAATVVGAAGVVATGTAAAVQGVKIKEQNDILKPKQAEINQKNNELEVLKLENKK